MEERRKEAKLEQREEEQRNESKLRIFTVI